MKKILKPIMTSLFLVLMTTFYLQAQEKPAAPFSAKNALYLEAGGNAVYYSVNYERLFYQQAHFKIAARTGFSFIPRKITNETYSDFFFPFELIGLLGKSSHHLELGVGVTPIIFPGTKINLTTAEHEYDTYKFDAIIPLRIGYRYQKPEGGFFFRFGYTPFLSLEEPPFSRTSFILLFGGLSVGKSF
jgi:hypothetical protein